MVAKVDPIATIFDRAQSFGFRIHLNDGLDLLHLLFLLDLVNLDLLVDETAFNQQLLVCCEFYVEELTLVFESDQDIWVLHGLVEIVKFCPVVLFFLLLFFLLLLLLLLFLVFHEEGLGYFDVVLTLSIVTNEKVQWSWKRDVPILI